MKKRKAFDAIIDSLSTNAHNRYAQQEQLKNSNKIIMFIIFLTILELLSKTPSIMA